MNANSRPGAGCPGKPHHLYIVAPLSCPYSHTYIHELRKQAAGLGRAAYARPLPLYTCQYIYKPCKNKQPAWGGVPGAALPCPYVHASLHTNWGSKQPAWGGLPRPHHLSIHVHTYKVEKQEACLGRGRLSWGSLAANIAACLGRPA